MASDMPFSMNQVLDLVHAEMKGKGRWRDVSCPYANGKEIRVNVEEGTWNCFHECSTCPRHPRPGSSGILDLYCFFMNVENRPQAYKQLMSTFYGDAFVPKAYTPPKKEPVEQQDDDPSDDESLAPIEVRDAAYRYFLSLCVLTKVHRKELHARGLTDRDIDKIGYRSVPQSGLRQMARALVGAGVNLDKVPGFYFDKKSGTYNIFPHQSGIFIPYFDVNGKIQGLQIRYDVKITDDMPEETVKELKKKRYRWFSSAYAEYKFGNGTGSKNYAYFGSLNLYKEDNPEGVVYVTEGALKAQVAESLCKKVYGKQRIFVAVPGVSCYTTFRALCRKLKENGIVRMVDVFDSDRHKNESVMNAIRTMKGISESYGIEFISWNFGTKQKGIDDFLLEKASRSGRR